MESIFPPSGRVRAKICGITSESQAVEIANLGADALGFNFWPKSKRFLDPDSNVGWLKGLTGLTVRIGVFVNAGKDEICRRLEEDLIDWAQLHGDESPEMVRELQSSGWNVFKAIGVKDYQSLEVLEQLSGPILLDAYAPTEYGGSGQKMDWALGAEAVQRYSDREIILAGGLRPDNVSQAIAQVHPSAVDVASGVEVSPGIKDIELCRDFIRETAACSQ